jgi:multicomponent Na+:H+ antiporter subunit E
MTRLMAIFSFLGFYLVEVLKANLLIAVDILTPRNRMTPRFVTVRLDPLTHRQLLLLTNVITMTPGTICLDISPDGRDLLIHSLYAKSDDELIRSVKDDYERRIRDVF